MKTVILNFFRIIGLCLLQNELCPMFLNRHVLKYILGRPVRFHDLAFFDPVVYESLRQLVVDAETGDAHSLFATLDLNFRYCFMIILILLTFEEMGIKQCKCCCFMKKYLFNVLLLVWKCVKKKVEVVLN